MVNHACKKLESDIHKLAPEGGTITLAQLIQATVLLNFLIRRKSKFPANDIQMAQNGNTIQNIDLNDSKLHDIQI